MPNSFEILIDGGSASSNAQVTGVIAPTKVISATNGLVINNLIVSESYTIPIGYSAMSAGSMTINSGITVTIPSGSRWVVL